MAETLAVMVTGEKEAGGESEEIMPRTRSGSCDLEKYQVVDAFVFL